MIAEAILHLTARSDPVLRRHGLVGSAVALWSRATRRARAWAPHEERCHRAIRTCIEELPARRIAVVLGSGLLRDVPVAELAAAFDRVVLIDAVHLWPARRLARRLGCEIMVADLSDPLGPGAQELAAIARDPAVDLVVSANLLSQLPLPAIRDLPDGAASDAVAGSILRHHLDFLGSFSCRVCLLSDVGYRDVDRDGHVLDEADLMHGLALPSPDETWDWQVAPHGELDRRFARIHRVHAWRDFRRASG